jgi:hypothetical protein
MKDGALDKNEKGTPVSNILGKRRNLMERLLTADQRKKLTELKDGFKNDHKAPVSLRQRQQNKVADRLNEKGITVKTTS